MTKRVLRIGIGGAVAAVVFGLLTTASPPPAAASSEWLCVGREVKRCATVWYDEGTHTFQARARIHDAAGGRNFSVRVTHVVLRNFMGGKDRVIRQTRDYDGWHAKADYSRTRTVNPCNWENRSFTVAATFEWKGADSGKRRWSPNRAWGPGWC